MKFPDHCGQSLISFGSSLRLVFEGAYWLGKSKSAILICARYSREEGLEHPSTTSGETSFWFHQISDDWLLTAEPELKQDVEQIFAPEDWLLTE